MRPLLPTFLAIALVAAMPARAADPPAPAKSQFTFKFEGLLQGDAAFYDSAELDGGAGDGDTRDHGIRRAELVIGGNLTERTDWVVGYDARSKRWLDVRLRQKFGADGAHVLQVGQFKQPQGLEELGSSRHNDFIAKAAATNVFGAGRRLGIGYAWGNASWDIQASAFGPDIYAHDSDTRAVGGRLLWRPQLGEGNTLQLGISHVQRDPADQAPRLRTRPNADLAGVYRVDTGALRDADAVATTGLEAVFVHGPLKLQGEYFRAGIDRDLAPDGSAHGGYLSGIWNLGSSWNLRGGVTAPKLDESSQLHWQFGLRYDTLDLDGGSLSGGRMQAFTAGVSAYYGKHLRAMVNQVQAHSTRNGATHDDSITELRLQFHW